MKPTPSPSRESASLGVEPLETRCVPACMIQALPGTLIILGDRTDNFIQIADNGAPIGPNIQVICDGVAEMIPPQNFPNINVRSADGNDMVTYTQTGIQMGDRNIVADLGGGQEAGSDSFTANLSHAVAQDRRLNINARGGDGNDSLEIIARGFGIRQGAQVTFALFGETADDFLVIRYRGRIFGSLETTMLGGGGNDLVAASLIAAPGSDGSITANLLGQDGDDTLALLLRNRRGSTAALSGAIDGGMGDNLCFATAGVVVANCRAC